MPHEAITNVALAIGVFDGVHIGHKMILERLKQLSTELGIKNLVITLSPDPEKIINPDNNFTILTSISDKIASFEEVGIDSCFILEVDKPLLSYDAVDFFENFIHKKFNPKAIVVGEDFRFGANQMGDIELLSELCRKHKIELHVLPFFKSFGEKVSSSRIREVLAKGDIQSAAIMLGRSPKITGRVVPGEGRGRKLGFPTANILPEHEFELASGVYLGEVLIKEESLPALLYIGTKPSFGGKILSREIYIPNFGGYLYGKSISFLIHQMLREEKLFLSKDSIRRQLEVDRECLIRHLSFLSRV